MNHYHYSFANDAWKKELVQAYSFRFTETPDFTQAGDHVTTAANPTHREGFDNISLLSPETDVFCGCEGASQMLVRRHRMP